jgi:hypothetical protein
MVVIKDTDSKKGKSGFDFIPFFVGFLIGTGIGGLLVGLLFGVFMGFMAPKTGVGTKNSLLLIAIIILIAKYVF